MDHLSAPVQLNAATHSELTPDQRIENRTSIERLPDQPFLGFAAGNSKIM
jgi:hypothetical protein